jgi:hypothetical protein
MERAMSDTRSRSGILVGLAAAAGAVGAAATLSAATAFTAHADDFTDVINAVDADYTIGAAAFTTADTDFSGGDFAPGLAALFDGADDDSVVAPENFLIGTGDLLTNEAVDVTNTYDWVLPTDFSNAVSIAESFVEDSAAYFSTAGTELTGGDYLDAFMEYAYALNAFAVDPLQELLLGAAVSF